jgi:hypothetical protein
MCNGNYESWARFLGKDSIVRWHFRSFKRKHEGIAAMEASLDGPPVVRIRSHADLVRLIATVSVSHGT